MPDRDSTTQRPVTDLPEVGAALPCGHTDCPAPRFELGFGLAGGGYGVYEFCALCGRVVSKTEEREEP